MLKPDETSDKCVQQFFHMFKVNSEKSAEADNVDITYLLKAVPTKVLTQNIE